MEKPFRGDLLMRGVLSPRRLRRLLPGTRRDGLPSAPRSTPPAPVPHNSFAPLTELRRSAGGENVYDPVSLRRRRWFDLDRGFGALLVIGLPVLVAMVYYGLIAADRFVSQSEIVLRSVGSADTSGLSAMIASQGGAAVSAGLSVGGDRDAQAVATFIASHDGMAAADRALDLRKLFARPEADRFSGYPGVIFADTNHALHGYYEDMVAVSYDATTGVIKLSAQAFRPEDAKAIGETLISQAETLVNRMDLRARQDAIRTAQQQVDIARVQVVEAQEKLTAFRLRERMVDPVKMSAVVIESIAQLLAKSVELKAQLSNLLKNTPANQQASVLRNQIDAIEGQIAAQQRKLTGPDGSISPILAEFAQLSLQSGFADRIYTASLDQLESARAAAARQHAFIERISGPTLSDYSTEPRRMLMVLGVLALSLCIWCVLRFVTRDLRAHHGR